MWRVNVVSPFSPLLCDCLPCLMLFVYGLSVIITTQGLAHCPLVTDRLKLHMDRPGLSGLIHLRTELTLLCPHRRCGRRAIHKLDHFMISSYSPLHNVLHHRVYHQCGCDVAYRWDTKVVTLCQQVPTGHFGYRIKTMHFITICNDLFLLNHNHTISSSC